MLNVMFAPHDYLTIMVMGSFLSTRMQMYSESKGRHSMQTNGLGDIKGLLMVKIFNAKRQSFHVNAGLSFPTGSITENTHPPGTEGSDYLRSPYLMQLGSGTWDLMFSGTYLGQTDFYSWGVQLNSTIRTNLNSQGWKFGNKYSGAAWMAFNLMNIVSASLSLKTCYSLPIEGEDKDLTLPTPVAKSENYGGLFFSGSFGVNFYIPNGIFKNLRLSFEYEAPFYQNVNGIQMAWVRTISLCAQYTFSLF